MLPFAKENHPLAPLTLYRVGGPARIALFPSTPEEGCRASEWMQAQAGPRLVLGGGSNVLISDAGFPGTVLVTTGLEGIEPLGDDRYRILGGTDLAKIVQEVMLPNNYAGVGALAGIPGSVGGAIFMNAGTSNGTTCQFLESVDLVSAGRRTAVPVEPSQYGYRDQQFCPRDALILSGIFRFARSDEEQRPIYDHYMDRRARTQPRGHCCGSVFRNPEGDHAGRLIEACGLKGTRRGDAVISPVHANFIVNEGQAGFDDILFLIELCRQRVREQFGITLIEEVAIIR